MFFDVDDTLLTWNWRLRPYAREVIAELAASGFEGYIRSGRRRRWDFRDTSLRAKGVQNGLGTRQRALVLHAAV
ncbi:MAG TPA: HAD hydrolase family protein [Dehalococcoidia bacterium]|jgi:predicted HAD superfamily phosphohydrolase YqeG|nr:HAD hydrolase family protein [Dehalococcoidia bacterium]